MAPENISSKESENIDVEEEIFSHAENQIGKKIKSSEFLLEELDRISPTHPEDINEKNDIEREIVLNKKVFLDRIKALRNAVIVAAALSSSPAIASDQDSTSPAESGPIATESQEEEKKDASAEFVKVEDIKTVEEAKKVIAKDEIDEIVEKLTPGVINLASANSAQKVLNASMSLAITGVDVLYISKIKTVGDTTSSIEEKIRAGSSLVKLAPGKVGMVAKFLREGIDLKRQLQELKDASPFEVTEKIVRFAINFIPSYGIAGIAYDVLRNRAVAAYKDKERFARDNPSTFPASAE